MKNNIICFERKTITFLSWLKKYIKFVLSEINNDLERNELDRIIEKYRFEKEFKCEHK